MPVTHYVSPDDAKKLSAEFVPIILSAEGEALDHYPLTRGLNGLGARDFEQDSLSTCCGVHHICRGCVDHQQVSMTHAALHCRSCHWRVVIPLELKTLGDLRKWASELFKQREERWEPKL